MSSGNDQSSRKSAEGAEMEASQTQSTSDSSPQARPDQRDEDTNNSNVSMLNEKANTENSDKTGEHRKLMITYTFQNWTRNPLR